MSSPAKYMREYMREYRKSEKYKNYYEGYKVAKKRKYNLEKFEKEERRKKYNELVFNLHKEDIVEDTIKYKNLLIKKYDLDRTEVHDLFVKIINYQIDKYGCQKQKYNGYVSKDDYYHINTKHKLRKQGRIKKQWF